MENGTAKKATIILVAIALCIGVSASSETTAVGNVPKALVPGSHVGLEPISGHRFSIRVRPPKVISRKWSRR